MVVCLLLSNTIIRGLLVITTELFPRTAIKEDVLRILLMCIFMSLYSCIRFGAIWQGKMIWLLLLVSKKLGCGTIVEQVSGSSWDH